MFYSSSGEESNPISSIELPKMPLHFPRKPIVLNQLIFIPADLVLRKFIQLRDKRAPGRHYWSPNKQYDGYHCFPYTLHEFLLRLRMQGYWCNVKVRMKLSSCSDYLLLKALDARSIGCWVTECNDMVTRRINLNVLHTGSLEKEGKGHEEIGFLSLSLLLVVVLGAAKAFWNKDKFLAVRTDEILQLGIVGENLPFAICAVFTEIVVREVV